MNRVATQNPTSSAAERDSQVDCMWSSSAAQRSQWRRPAFRKLAGQKPSELWNRVQSVSVCTGESA
jgi:hypothetical protein